MAKRTRASNGTASGPPHSPSHGTNDAKPTGTAVAILPNKRRRNKADFKPKVEKLPEPQGLMVPAALLLAAESVSMKNDPNRQYLQGVRLHLQDGRGRAVATDGFRLFISSFEIDGDVPAWLEEGITLSNDGLKARVAMIARGVPAAQVRLWYAAGWAKASMADPLDSMSFKVDVVDGTFPDYERIIPARTFQSLDEDGAVRGQEWEPIGINSSFLKHVGELAKTLEAGLAPVERSKTGMVVRAYNNSAEANQPLVFDFSTWPGALLIIMPAKLSTPGISQETAAILAPAIKLTIAALRAHATRNRAWAAEAKDDIQKEEFDTKALRFEARIAEILQRAPGLPALTNEAEKPAPDPESEADNAEQDAADAVRKSGDPEEDEEGNPIHGGAEQPAGDEHQAAAE